MGSTQSKMTAISEALTNVRAWPMHAIRWDAARRVAINYYGAELSHTTKHETHIYRLANGQKVALGGKDATSHRSSISDLIRRLEDVLVTPCVFLALMDAEKGVVWSGRKPDAVIVLSEAARAKADRLLQDYSYQPTIVRDAVELLNVMANGAPKEEKVEEKVDKGPTVTIPKEEPKAQAEENGFDYGLQEALDLLFPGATGQQRNTIAHRARGWLRKEKVPVSKVGRNLHLTSSGLDRLAAWAKEQPEWEPAKAKETIDKVAESKEAKVELRAKPEPITLPRTEERTPVYRAAKDTTREQGGGVSEAVYAEAILQLCAHFGAMPVMDGFRLQPEATVVRLAERVKDGKR